MAGPVPENELKKSITIANYPVEKVVTLDALKEIDEEVQYAIAKHESHLNPWCKESLLLYLCLLVSFLNATSSGFDGRGATGLLFVLYNAASTNGCAFGDPIVDYFGRRRAGAALAAGAQTLDHFKASWFLLGFDIILQTLSAPVYVTEIIPPQLVLLCLSLLAAIIYKYHGGPDNEVAKLEVREAALHVKLSKPQTPWEYIRGLWDYRELFNSHSARWRTGMITLITLASSLSGNSILTFSLPTMLASVGVKSIRRKLLLTFASSIFNPAYSHLCISCSGAVIGSATNDWIGRRTRFVWGSFSLASALALVAGMSSQVAAATAAGDTPSKAISGVGIFSILLFGWIFSFVYTPNQSLYCTEVQNQVIRAKGISLHALESNLAMIFFTYITSIALGDISWKTCNRTIEELDSCFEAHFPPRASWKRTKIVQGENNELEVEIEGIKV
ncbi:Lactose permease [Lachnellula occidentalis]|uniref:Lactose permease n=1 Tax=Lachnellula occidentalis TaxID=215460 RepID=A0A8H8RL70_9HELO|nr:Lactose permease [Lachnellula occidentalis]